MKVVCNPNLINEPYSYEKDKVYDCEIIYHEGKIVYQVLNPEWLQMMRKLSNGVNFGYCDKFSKVYFDRYFIDIKEQRKLKLKKINATNI